MAPLSVLSPRLATPIPFANTRLDAWFTLAAWNLQKGPTGNVCGCTGSPLLKSGFPFANTEYCVVLTGALPVQPCPVTHLSLCLDTLGMPVFMEAKNGHYFLSLRCIASGIKRGFSSQPTTGASIKK